MPVDVLTLIGKTWDGATPIINRRDVLGNQLGVGYREFYAAHGTDYHPVCKFRLSDNLDYQGETLAELGGILYRIMRTYPDGQALELTLERETSEEVLA